MIVLDTNVASELMRPQPARNVADWLDQTGVDELYLNSITWLELKFGVGVLPDGKRKTQLTEELDKLRRLLTGRILPFDPAAAEETARFSALRQKVGRKIDWRDSQIAGITLSRSAILATRNVRDFDGAGLKLINPWNSDL